MKVRFSLLMFLVCNLVFAQKSKVEGRIIDKESGEPIEYGTVSIFKAADSTLIDGTISNEKGLFFLSISNESEVYISAQFLGYSPYFSDHFLPISDMEIAEINLELNNTTLDEVIVTGRAATAVYKLDKQVFDAKQFQNARGGNASDVLRNLPSISINSFGEISVRGATGFLVMVNGKPVQGDPLAILQQLSANSIEDIEVVTAPSAKYDPDGNAGIINIKTKQALQEGMYLAANVLAGLPSIEAYDNMSAASRYGADLTYNLKSGKWDFSAALDYRKYDISGRREGYVNTYLNETLTEFPSDGERSFDEVNYSARTSLRYTPVSNQTVTVGLYLGKRTKDRAADILYNNQQRTLISNSNFTSPRAYYDSYLRTGAVLAEGNKTSNFTYFNENLRVRRSDFIIGSVDYAIKLVDKSSLKFSALYERTVLGGPTDNANLAFPNTEQILQLQFNDNQNPLDGVRLQVDYGKEIAGVKWESGYQYRYLQHPGDFQYFDRDLDQNIWVENPLFTNSINLTRSIHSAYSQVGGSKGKLEYIAGLRLEYFNRIVEIARPDEKFELAKLNLFPSFNLGYDLGQGYSTKGGYSRRIERTTTFKMTPFPEREHSETLEQGDAELLPEYIDLVELGMVKSWGENSFFATAYYRYVNNVINRVNTIFNDTILNRIYTNVGQSNSYGIELGSTLYPHKNWRLYFGGNVFNYKIKGSVFEEEFNTTNTVFSINANTNVKLTPSLDVQVAFNYLSARITAQGEDSAFYNPSLSLKKSFLDDRLSLSLQWQNIDLGLWAANEQRITTERSKFFTTTNYVYEVDILQLSLSYRINQVSKKINLPDSEFGKKEF